MTAPAGRETHPDVDEISDLTEGLLAPERAAEVRTHLASCALCADVLASLQEIQGLLGGLPPVEPMPPDVAARIEAALGAEPLPAAQPTAAPSDVPRETSLPSTGHPGADVSRGTSAPPGRPAGTAGPGRSSRRRRSLWIAAPTIAAALALGVVTFQSVQHGDPGEKRADSSSGADRSAARAPENSSTVGDQVARLLAGSGSSNSKGADSPLLTPKDGTTVTAPDGTVTAVPACVLQATQRAQSPLAAERESYQGLDSYLVVLPAPADATRVDAFVVTAACTATVPARVLFQSSYPRG